MAARIKLAVEMEDGTAYEVTADQRDLARWELQAECAEGRDVLRQRFLAFSAASRSKQTELSWPKFNAACVEVVGADDEAEAVDPTRPAASGDH